MVFEIKITASSAWKLVISLMGERLGADMDENTNKQKPGIHTNSAVWIPGIFILYGKERLDVKRPLIL
ncbi:hypothetical protein SporoP37_10325 [Sporosarcina sp. P37]|uniref:hypothetical protein n=1 Tax=Sporosarcina sp. P35 TaxID=2048246 RepID=UPI000A17D56B|nr:hypothetical protein [Sporosarcina sp. P35]ARK25002.1 hypothetical protein SporoP37_10325 [Sporosarcina sp. P37]PID18147.1 hypothetical protein CSV62_09660 [Sporosarcina sp. P35]